MRDFEYWVDEENLEEFGIELEGKNFQELDYQIQELVSRCDEEILLFGVYAHSDSPFLYSTHLEDEEEMKLWEMEYVGHTLTHRKYYAFQEACAVKWFYKPRDDSKEEKKVIH